MRFSLFYPVAVALIGGMVYAALSPGLERLAVWRATLAAMPTQGLTYDGAQLSQLIATDRASMELVEAVLPPIARIGSTGVVTPQQNYGAHLFVPVDAVRRLAGVDADIVLDVRSAREGGSDAWQVRVVVPGVLDTQWRTFTAEPAWTSQTVHLSVPDVSILRPMDIMFWSDADGDDGKIDLKRVTIRLRTDADFALDRSS